MHPRDQWFRIYVFTPGVAAPVLVGPAPKDGEPDTRKVEARWIQDPTWKPIDDVEHVHHPDAYHPDVRLRVQHHRTMRKDGVAIAACGLVHDPRVRFVESEGKPKKPCPECFAATEKAIADHLAVIHELERAAAETEAARGRKPTEADFDQEEIPTGH